MGDVGIRDVDIKDRTFADRLRNRTFADRPRKDRTMADEEVVESCNNCRFWNPSWKYKRQQHNESGALRKESAKGLCRRYAPPSSALTTVWSATMGTDWCGDYERIA